MATFTLQQLQEKHGLGAEPKRSFGLEDIQRNTRTTQQTEGNQFEGEKGFFGKLGNVGSSIVGGKSLGEGLGQGIAAPKLQRNLSSIEQSMSDTDLQLIQRIQEKAQRGEDTTRLEKARLQLLEDIKITRDVQEDFVNSLPSNKEVKGSAVRLGATLVAPTIGKGAVKATGLGSGITGIGSGILRGAGAGALAGGIEGAAQGLGIGIEENKSIGKSVALGATFGFATGGILGGVLGGFAGRKAGQAGFAEDLVKPKATAKVKAKGITKGDFESPGLFRPGRLSNTLRDKKLANSIRNVVSPKNSLRQNVDAIENLVSSTDDGLRNYVANNKVPFNTNQLRSQLVQGKSDLKLVFASDATSERTYNAVVDAFMEQLQKGDTQGLLEARRSFDQLPAVQKLLQTEGLGENARREIVLAVRGAANRYTASLLPQGNTFRADLLQEHYMLEALSNIGDSNAHIIGKNQIQLLTQKYPILKWIAGGIAASAVFGGGVGAGGAIIGSTD